MDKQIENESLSEEIMPDAQVNRRQRPSAQRVLTAEIVAYLKHTLRLFQDKDWQPSELVIMRAVIDHGRPYVGISRPKGYRKRKARQCFWNAADFALTDRGTYVEGYASSSTGGVPVHHAWLTLDGVHAIDVTWGAPADCHYVGIAFPNEIVARYGLQGRDWVPLLPHHQPSAALRALLAAAASDAV